MSSDKYQSGKAARWSSITEILARLVSPVTNMILARLLLPETFGVVAMITMITSFADIFTDAGFQKYLIQHEFKDYKELEDSANVALWANFIISVIIWMIICINSEKLAEIIGCPGLGMVVSVACSILPMTSFSSIQRALFKRAFDYKSLFLVRMVHACIPLIVTVPLALMGFEYWALIIGNIFAEFMNAVLLVWKSKWKPKRFFSISIFRNMFSYSFWTMIESISIWLTSWVGTFIVGSILTQHYLGLYKTSISTVNSLMAIVTTAFTSVLFSLLARYQDDRDKFLDIFFKYQKFVGCLVLPMGLGLYLYRTLATGLFLGEQWMEAADFIGMWGLVYAVSIPFGHFCSEAYRATGRPKISVLAQWMHIAVLIPACYLGAGRGFATLAVWRSLTRLEFILVHFILMQTIYHISPWSMVKNVKGAIISTLCMGGTALCLQQVSDNIGYQILSIGICILIYFAVLSRFENIRKIVTDVLSDRKERK